MQIVNAFRHPYLGAAVGHGFNPRLTFVRALAIEGMNSKNVAIKNLSSMADQLDRSTGDNTDLEEV